MSLSLSILTVFQSFFNSILNRLQLPNVIMGIVFAVVGIAFATLAKRIARIVRKKNDIPDDDKVMITLKVIGLVCLFIALLVLVFKN